MQDFITFLGHHLYLTTSILCVAFFLFIIEMWRMQKLLKGLSPQAAIQLINHQHAVILDLREEATFKQGHIVHAVNISSADALAIKKIEKFKQKPLVIVCPTGVTANKTAHELTKKGFNAHVLQGGMKAWYDANLPTVKETHHG